MKYLSVIPPEGVWFVAGVGLTIAAAVWFVKIRRNRRRIADEHEAGSLLARAQRERDTLLREARLAANEEAAALRRQTEESFAGRKEELTQREKRLTEREAVVNHQLQEMVKEEDRLRERADEWRRKSEELTSQREEVERLINTRREEIARIGQLSPEEARSQMLKEVEQQTAQEANQLGHRILEAAKTRAEEKARQIISIAIQRYAGEHTFESSTATVSLTGDEIKGRIIGREGRNIRAFEAATGVTVLIDDTPNAVVLSGFDPVRREIARESMQRLVQDGRIHPTRIEEVVAKVTEEIDDSITEAGENAVIKTGLPPLHPEIVKLLGRLRFRHSFSQNILDHSIEVAHLTGLMAAEMGLDVQTAKRAGLLHDIGKAVNHEIEGSHAIVGADLIKRYGESEAIVNGVASHHEEIPPVGPWGILVSAADAISASRPGARSETMTTYLKRVESLERIALGFDGVDKAYAVQAGRELRVIVKPDQVTDDESNQLVRLIARKIESELQYPGQIRVIVVRETRSTELAK